MEIVGYLIALLAGMLLGLIGGGGSIIIVPLLIYVFHVGPLLAMAYSLFIVGATSLFGVFTKYKAGLVDFKAAFIFGIPSAMAVYITRRWIIPTIPATVASFNGLVLTKQSMLLLIFGLLMIVASLSMILDKSKKRDLENTGSVNYILVILQGILEGFITGLVGAGGGFLIIAILVLFSKLPIKRAIGTSLLIIAVKTLIGFSVDVSNYPIDWKFLMPLTLLAVLGIFIGSALSKHISGEILKKGFGWFVLIMGIYIIAHEFFLRLIN